MFPHAFCGDLAKDQKIKILILGESHHWETEDYGDSEERIAYRKRKEAAYSTAEVVNRYLNNCRDNGHPEPAHAFFDKIVQAFGIDPDTSREAFWDRVHFGNYIDRICGVGDDQAVRLLKNSFEQYNDDLFNHINGHHIDIVCCFSRRVYGKLPDFADPAQERREPIENLFIRCQTGTVKRDRITQCVYLPNTPHRHTNIMLKKPLTVYGMLHPSGRYGFDPTNYAPVLRPLIDL